MTWTITRRNEAAGGRQAGFSLLELLVVIGIIAILALLLLPATGTIMEICRETVCRGNLRQLGVAAFAYHTDNEIMPKTGEWVPPDYNWTVWSATNGTLYPFVKDYRSFLCPTFYRGVRDLPPIGNRGGPDTRRSYSMNGFGYEINSPVRLNEVRLPASKVFFAEENWWAPTVADGVIVGTDWLNDGMLHWVRNGTDDGIGTFHRGALCMASYMDGHAGKFKVDKDYVWKTKVCKE